MVQSSLEGLRVQKDWEESRDRVTSRNMLTVWVPHGIHIVHACIIEIKSMMSEYMYTAYWPRGRCMVDEVMDMRTEHGHQGRHKEVVV